MQYPFSEEQLAIADLTRNFMEREVAPVADGLHITAQDASMGNVQKIFDALGEIDVGFVAEADEGADARPGFLKAGEHAGAQRAALGDDGDRAEG